MAVSQTRFQPHPVEVVDPAQADRLDGFVIRAQAAERRFRRLDQEQVDAIVGAMVRPGWSRLELAAARGRGDRVRRLRGQGREELRRHRVPLRLPADKQSVGVIDEDRGAAWRRRRADRRDPRDHPDHQPDLDGAVQGDLRGEDAQRDRLPPVAAGGPLRRAGGRGPPGGGRGGGAAPGALRSIPDPSTTSAVPAPPPRRRLPLDHRRTRWSRRPTPRASRRSASAPATRRATSTAPPTSRMAVVDILISKTFDASVICPAEQTCVVDDGDLRRGLAEFQRMGAHLLEPRRSTRSPSFAFGPRRQVEPRRPRPAAPELARRAGFEVPRGHQGPARPAAVRPRRAGGPPAGPGEAHAGARPGPLARGRARAHRRAARHRARRARAHLGRLRPRRRGDRPLRRARSAPGGSSSTPRPRSGPSAGSTTP